MTQIHMDNQALAAWGTPHVSKTNVQDCMLAGACAAHNSVVVFCNHKVVAMLVNIKSA